MFFVPCPRCGSPVDIPEDAVGNDRTDPWNVAHCHQCDIGFDYDDAEVQCIAEESQVHQR